MNQYRFHNPITGKTMEVKVHKPEVVDGKSPLLKPAVTVVEVEETKGVMQTDKDAAK